MTLQASDYIALISSGVLFIAWLVRLEAKMKETEKDLKEMKKEYSETLKGLKDDTTEIKITIEHIKTLLEK